MFSREVDINFCGFEGFENADPDVLAMSLVSLNKKCYTNSTFTWTPEHSDRRRWGKREEDVEEEVEEEKEGVEDEEDVKDVKEGEW